ncbi:MAG: FkbM family methyltransferase, partial [Terriglobales bacterium]
FCCGVVNCRDLPVKFFNAPAGNGEKVSLIYDAPHCGNLPNLGMRSVRTTNEDDKSGVRTIKIDDLNLPSCKFMKIDCEGSEIPTLFGARDTIKRCRPVLFVEMFPSGLGWRNFTPRFLEDTLRSMGYNLEQIGPNERFDWFCTPI